MLSSVSVLLLLGLAALALAGHSSSEEHSRGRPSEPRRPWYWRRFFGRGKHGGAPWMPPHGPHGPPGKHGRGPPFPPPPFLKEASEDARKEFFAIFENSNQTKAQTKERVHEWAAKQSSTIQDGVAAFERNLTLAKEDAKKNATDVILQLETALDRFTTILEDDSLTQRETMQKLRNAARSFDRDVVFAVKMIMRNARFRTGAKYFPRPEHGPFPENMPFPPPPFAGIMPPPPPPHPEGMPFPPPPPHGGPMLPPPPPPMGPEGPIDLFFPPPPSPKEEKENTDDFGIFLPGDF